VAALVVGETRRYLAEFDRKRAAEAAARFAFGHFLERKAGNPGEQRARLRLCAHLAQPRAAVVIGHAAFETAGYAVELRVVDEKIGELARLCGKCRHAPAHGRIVGEEIGVVRADHAAAGAGRRDQEVAILEFGDDLRRECACVLAIAAIVGRLAAAGLRRGNDDRCARRFEQAESGEANRRAHQVDEAGDEQTDTHRSAIPKTKGRGHLTTALVHAVVCASVRPIIARMTCANSATCRVIGVT